MHGSHARRDHGTSSVHFSRLGQLRQEIGQRGPHKIALDNTHQLVAKEPEDWDVRGSMMIQDGIETAKSARILIKIGTETLVIKYCERFIRLLRKNSSRLPQIKVLWETFTWERSPCDADATERVFPSITDELMTDLTAVNDALMQSPPKK